MTMRLSGMETELQRLLLERLEALGEKWNANRKQRELLDWEAEQLQQDIGTVQQACALEARLNGQPDTTSSNGDNRFLGLNLRQSVALLVDESPAIDFSAIRKRLEAAHFDFKGKKPGNAINMALVSLKREKGASKK